MSKGYTLNFFIDAVENTTASVWNENTFLGNIHYGDVISPRAGITSVKVEVLNEFLGFELGDIVDGVGDFAKLGKTPRTRLLKALRLRKKNGNIIL